MTEPLILDNTKRSTFRRCKKMYQLQHLLGLQSNWGSTAIRYGVTWHGIQEGFHQHIKEHGWTDIPTGLLRGLELGKKLYDKESLTKSFNDDYRNFNTAAEGFNQYLINFSNDAEYIKVLGTESTFECPITADNELEYKLLSSLPPIIFTGKIDLSVQMDHMNWIWDFKSTGWRLDAMVMQAGRSPQIIGYSYAGERSLDFKPNGAIISFAYIAARKNKMGEYGSITYDFRRVPQIYTEGDISAWKLSFIDTCRDITQCMESGIWAESFDNCYQYGPCSYLRLCQQHCPVTELNTEGFHEEFWSVLDDVE